MMRATQTKGPRMTDRPTAQAPATQPRLRPGPVAMAFAAALLLAAACWRATAAS